ncbi:signal recognition particle-docking protein FtsY [Tissierella creatinini]|nr:signal recognition particle-docking protein FtsY [Tissierella creatinini]TJX69177.1 signal recognition particle-docking protein FtsY [Soehngenia saccharolytica]
MFNWFKKKKKNPEEGNYVEKEVGESLESQEGDPFELEPKDVINEDVQDEISLEELEKEALSFETEEEIDIIIEETNEIIEESVETRKDIAEEIQQVEEPVKKLNFFEKLKSGLTKTRNDMSNKIEGILNSYKKVDEEFFDDLEEILVTADVGMNTTMEIIDRLKCRIKAEKVNDPHEVKELLKDEIRKLMKESVNNNELKLDPLPAVLLVVGVNGVGKTTTIGKLSNTLRLEGKKVLIAAGDTFRAAAIEQLEEWSKRSKVEFIAHTEGADPAAVIFDGIQAAKARKTDVLICDTAGRLHNKSNLMNELNKIFRVVEREYPDATKEVLLVLDATTGQNAINQAKVFKEVANISGVVLTKLDGTAKGGVIIALQTELNLPVKLVGVGEKIDDLQPFNVDDFVEAIFN